MSPTSRPSKVSGLKRGLGTAQPKPDDAEFTPATPAEQAAISELLMRPRPEKPVRFTLDLDLDRDRHPLPEGVRGADRGQGVGGHPRVA